MVRRKEKTLLQDKTMKEMSVGFFERFIESLVRRFPKWFEGGKVIDGYNYSIFLPFSQGVFEIVKLQPTHIVNFGDWGVGKTISAWTMTYVLWHYLREIGEGCEVHIYGDADTITETIKEMAGKIGDPELVAFSYDIVEHFEPPTEETWPQSTKKKVMIFNEMNVAGNSRRGMSSANIELAMKIWKERHSGEYPIFNVITPTSLDKIIRGAPVSLYHRTSVDNTMALERSLPPSWRCVADETMQLMEGEAIAVYSLFPYVKRHKSEGNLGTAIDIVHIKPPSWLLKIVDVAKTKEGEHGMKILYGPKAAKKKKDEDAEILWGKRGWYHIMLAEGRKKHPHLNFKKVFTFGREYFENGVPLHVACRDIGISVSSIKNLMKEKILIDDRVTIDD